MNKNISIYTSIVTVFATLWLKIFAIATPANAQPASNDLLLSKDSQIALNISNRESEDNLTKIVFFASLIGMGALSWQVFQSRRGVKSNFQPIKNKYNSALLDRVSPKLRRQLLRLVNDPKTANRLLMGISKKNSHRSPNWIAEKAIYDLRRGR